MGQAIVKAARDRDLYMVWSSVVDAPVAVGSRNQMVEYARQEVGFHQRLVRAAVGLT
jgi:hypothetical protein